MPRLSCPCWYWALAYLGFLANAGTGPWYEAASNGGCYAHCKHCAYSLLTVHLYCASKAASYCATETYIFF